MVSTRKHLRRCVRASARRDGGRRGSFTIRTKRSPMTRWGRPWQGRLNRPWHHPISTQRANAPSRLSDQRRGTYNRPSAR
jgi:hypothetical protein